MQYQEKDGNSSTKQFSNVNVGDDILTENFVGSGTFFDGNVTQEVYKVNDQPQFANPQTIDKLLTSLPFTISRYAISLSRTHYANQQMKIGNSTFSYQENGQIKIHNIIIILRIFNCYADGIGVIFYITTDMGFPLPPQRSRKFEGARSWRNVDYI